MKKNLALVIVLALCVSLLAGCGGSKQEAAPAPAETAAPAENAPAAAPEAAKENVKIRIGATPVPHAEILEIAKPILAEQGYDLEIIVYTDYVQPNLAVDSGELDANYFQHTPYLNSFNAENGTKVVSAGLVHYEPFGIFAGKTASIADLADGAKISIPNDATNGARALLLLQQEGIITRKDGVGVEATKYDIVDNPKNVELIEMEAAQLPLSLGDVDLAVINGNYALDAGLNPTTDALAIEDASGDAAQYYANLVGVKEGNENSEAIQALLTVLQSDAIKDFINSTYNGAVVPIF